MGNLEACSILLEYKVERNPTDNAGRTPLHKAVSGGHLEVCIILLENEADEDFKDDVGLTPLHLAAYYGHLDICKLLIEEGAEKYPRCNYGKTPLDMATQTHQTKVVSFFRNLRKRRHIQIDSIFDSNKTEKTSLKMKNSR